MLKIAHLITGLETGGAERMLMRLVTATDTSRFRSIVISMTGSDTGGPVVSNCSVPIHSLGIPRGLPDPRMIPRLVRLLRVYRPDVLQTWLYHADLLGLVVRELGVVPRLVWNLRCTDTTGTKFVRSLLRQSSGVPDAVVVNSVAGQRFHQKLGYRPRRWVHIPNGFNTDTLQPSQKTRAMGRCWLGLANDVVAILLPARHHLMKDHTNFFAAAAQLAARRSDVHFAIAGKGTGPENLDLMRAIQAYGLRERITPLGERSDLSSLYPAFDIVTLSSAFGEGFPNVLGEAMSSGIPCVGTDVGDVATIIDKTGRIVPPRDANALAAAWEELIELGAEGRFALGTAARARVMRNWDMDAIASQYGALYNQLMEQTLIERAGRAAWFAYLFATR